MNKVDTKELKAYVTEKCRRYAVKHGWEAVYEAEAVRWCLRGAAAAIVQAMKRGEKIKYPQRFAEYAAIQSLKHDRWGNLVIPYWTQEWRAANGVTVSYADKKEAL